MSGLPIGVTYWRHLLASLIGWHDFTSAGKPKTTKGPATVKKTADFLSKALLPLKANNSAFMVSVFR